MLAAVGAFSWYYAPDMRIASGAALALGVTLVAATVWRQASRGTGRRLFVPKARRGDLLVVVGAVGSIGIFIAMRMAGIGDVTYLPFPVLRAPAYSFAAAAGSLLLLVPLVTGDRP